VAHEVLRPGRRVAQEFDVLVVVDLEEGDAGVGAVGLLAVIGEVIAEEST
jgi:hypothetical protein